MEYYIYHKSCSRSIGNCTRIGGGYGGIINHIIYVLVRESNFFLTLFPSRDSFLKDVLPGAPWSIIIMAAAPFVTASEEIRQQIIGELAYGDRWALKQSCKLFATIIDIFTLKTSFSTCLLLRSERFNILRNEGFLLPNIQPCFQCRRFLPYTQFSFARKQRTKKSLNDLTNQFLTSSVGSNGITINAASRSTSALGRTRQQRRAGCVERLSITTLAVWTVAAAQSVFRPQKESENRMWCPMIDVDITSAAIHHLSCGKKDGADGSVH